MKKLIGVCVALLMAFCLTFTAFSWTVYDKEAVSKVVVSVQGAKINTDGSISIRVYVENCGQLTADNIEIGLITVAFSGISFDIRNCITGLSLGGGEAKRYTVKVSKKKVPSDISEEDLKSCAYDVLYAYITNEYTHSTYLSIETKGT